MASSVRCRRAGRSGRRGARALRAGSSSGARNSVRYSDEMMHAALDVNLPNYASAIVMTKQVIASISSL